MPNHTSTYHSNKIFSFHAFIFLPLYWEIVCRPKMRSISTYTIYSDMMWCVSWVQIAFCFCSYPMVGRHIGSNIYVVFLAIWLEMRFKDLVRCVCIHIYKMQSVRGPGYRNVSPDLQYAMYIYDR